MDPTHQTATPTARVTAWEFLWTCFYRALAPFVVLWVIVANVVALAWLFTGNSVLFLLFLERFTGTKYEFDEGVSVP
ncbi:MAG: hypothetical protein Q9210_000702 [Variospora velana]